MLRKLSDRIRNHSRQRSTSEGARRSPLDARDTLCSDGARSTYHVVPPSPANELGSRIGPETRHPIFTSQSFPRRSAERSSKAPVKLDFFPGGSRSRPAQQASPSVAKRLLASMSFNRNHVSSTTSTPANIREMNIGIPKKLKAEYTIRARREDSALPAASGPVTRPHRVPGSSGRPTDRATRQSAATLESLDLAVELAPPPVPARTAMIRYGGTGLQGTGYLAEATAVRSRNPRPDDGPFKVVVVDQANRISQTVSVHSQFPGSPVNQAAGACQPPPVPSPSGSPTSWDWPRPPTHMPPSVHAIVNTRVSPSSSDRSRRIHSPEQSLDKMQRRIELGLGADIKRGAPHVNKGNGRAVREKNRDGIVYHQIPDIARTREPAATYHGSTHRMRPSLPIGPLVANSMGVKARSQSRSPLAPVVPVHGTSALHTQTRSPMHAPSAPSHKIREKPVPVPFQPHQPEKLPAAPQPFKVPSQMEHKGVQNTRAMLPGWRA